MSRSDLPCLANEDIVPGIPEEISGKVIDNLIARRLAYTGKRAVMPRELSEKGIMDLLDRRAAFLIQYENQRDQALTAELAELDGKAAIDDQAQGATRINIVEMKNGVALRGQQRTTLIASSTEKSKRIMAQRIIVMAQKNVSHMMDEYLRLTTQPNEQDAMLFQAFFDSCKKFQSCEKVDYTVLDQIITTEDKIQALLG